MCLHTHTQSYISNFVTFSLTSSTRIYAHALARTHTHSCTYTRTLAVFLSLYYAHLQFSSRLCSCSFRSRQNGHCTSHTYTHTCPCFSPESFKHKQPRPPPQPEKPECVLTSLVGLKLLRDSAALDMSVLAFKNSLGQLLKPTRDIVHGIRYQYKNTVQRLKCHKLVGSGSSCRSCQ